MEALYNFSEHQMLAFFFTMVRMSSFIVAWPVFGVTNVPSHVKILLALTISFIIFPTLNTSAVQADMSAGYLIVLSIKESFVGLAIGYLARLFLFTFSMAGQIMSISMGLSGVQLFNPAMGEQSTAIDQTLVMLAGLFFLAINGHHLFLTGIVKSFDLVPLSMNLVHTGVFGHAGEMLQTIMVIGLKLSAPVMIAVLLMNLVMAIIGRAVPQINVLVTSLPVNILVGFLVFMISIPLIVTQMEGVLDVSAEYVFKLMKAM